MSLTGSVMILAVMLVRPLLKRWRTHGILMLLWVAACMMLLVHLRFSSPISVLSAVSNVPILSDAFAVGSAGSFSGSSNESTFMRAEGGYFLLEGYTSGLTYVYEIIFGIWLAGACAALIYAAVSALLLRKRFKDAVYRADLSIIAGRMAKDSSRHNISIAHNGAGHNADIEHTNVDAHSTDISRMAGVTRFAGNVRKTRVFVSSRTTSPLTYGIFRPKIILPLSACEAGSEALEHILLHEVQHIRSRHALINLLWFISLCLHWFNPIVWLGWVSLRSDMEISCDAKVIKHIGAERRTGYAQTLLNMVPVRQRALPLAFGTPSGKSSAKERIHEILAYRPATKGAVCISFAVMLLCMALFAASPAQMVMAESSFAISVSAMYPDDTGIHLFRVYSHGNNNGRNQSTFYVYAGGFATIFEAQGYFVENYSVETGAIEGYFAPEYATSHGFGFSFGPTFSWQGLNISVVADTGAVVYMLMDASTFSSEDIDLVRAMHELVGRGWSTSHLQGVVLGGE